MTEKFYYSLHKQARFRRIVHVSLLILITSLVFSNTLDNDYHLDSFHRVKENTEINKFWPPERFFTDVRTGSTVPQIAEYRPMMPLSHSINSEIAEATGTSKLTGFHVGNIAIHTGSAVLVYFLFCLLISHWGSIPGIRPQALNYSHEAFAAALIFAVHPISGSAVNYIAARDLLLMVFFFMASMMIFVGMRRKGDTVSGWFVSLLLLSLAILSKQVAILGFGLVFLFEWILCDVKLKDWRLWARTALFGIPTASYFLLRWLWITKQSTEVPLRVPADIYYPLSMAKAHVFYYMKNFVWPFEMRALAKFDLVETISDPAALAGLLFIASTLALTWLIRKRNPLISFSILAYWLLFSLTASVFPFRYVVTDYRQYPSLSFLCLIISLVCFSFKQRALTVALLVSMVLYFSFASVHINQHWKTEESFWHQSVKYGADALAHNNYGLSIAGKNPDLAEYHYLEAIRQAPFHIFANINLGMLYIRQNREEEGIQRLSMAVAWNPDRALAHYWLSIGLNSTGRTEEAIEELKRAADLDSRSLKYQYETARSLQSAGRVSDAIPYFERTIKINPDYEIVGFWLGYAYQKSGQPKKAIVTYNRFLERNSDHVQAHFNLAYALMNEDEYDAALQHFEHVITLRPQYLETHLHLSRCYNAIGDELQATKHMELYNQGK